MECVRVHKDDNLLWVFYLLAELAADGTITEEEKITVGMDLEAGTC